MINLKNQNFIASDTEILMHKNIFDNTENDPRILGKSSKKKNNITVINKGVFTSCKKNDSCPPWSMEANEIKHDQNKKEIFYKNAIFQNFFIQIRQCIEGQAFLNR